MPLPVPSQGFITKATNLTETGGARNFDNIFPFLISFENVFGRLADTALDIAMLEDLPHISISIYSLFSMSIRENG